MRVVPAVNSAKGILDDKQKISSVDKSGMLGFCVNIAKRFEEAVKIADGLKISYPKPSSIIVAGMGGSGIGGDLLKDWAKGKLKVSIEVNRDYHLPAYADKKTLVLITSYSGDTEESLSAFLEALKRKCMIFCISSGGALLDFARLHNVPYLKIPSGNPPRAALPYLLVPLLVCLEKLGLVSGVGAELSEARAVLSQAALDNSPERQIKENLAKTFAMDLEGTVPLVYGFGVFRGVSQRFKQQFNENSKMPSGWDFLPELDHNEIVGWEQAGDLTNVFSVIFLRDKDEPLEIKSRIEATKKLMWHLGVRMYEIYAQGNSNLAKMLSLICVGDFISVYLAVSRGIDPTPVETINTLKSALGKNGVKEKIIRELGNLSL
jgi:glucose/mannose-6-phosphate isomerase